MLHSTRSGRTDGPYLDRQAEEFGRTVQYFMGNAKGDSAHGVIGWRGEIAETVDDDLIAHHAEELNGRWLGVELTQPVENGPLSEAQYVSLVWWCLDKAAKYRFQLNESTLREHRITTQGVRSGKSDIGWPFSLAHLLAVIHVLD